MQKKRLKYWNTYWIILKWVVWVQTFGSVPPCEQWGKGTHSWSRERHPPKTRPTSTSCVLDANGILLQKKNKSYAQSCCTRSLCLSSMCSLSFKVFHEFVRTQPYPHLQMPVGPGTFRTSPHDPRSDSVLQRAMLPAHHQAWLPGSTSCARFRASRAGLRCQAIAKSHLDIDLNWFTAYCFMFV